MQISLTPRMWQWISENVGSGLYSSSNEVILEGLRLLKINKLAGRNNDMSITCLIKKEGNQYASLCVELDVASCGKSKTEAIDGLKRAIETYIEYMVSEGRQKEIYRSVPMDELKGFLFPADESSEKTFRAILMNYQYA